MKPWRISLTLVMAMILLFALRPVDAQAPETHKIYLPEVMKMTQISRPQQGRRTNYPDAGGYTANQWARLFRLFTGDYDDMGVFYRYLDALEVTNPAGVTIRVAKGAGLVNGHFFWNEDETDPEGNASNVDFTPSTPAASRTDIVVMVQNNSDSAYDGTPDYGSAVLEFPSTLTDYDGTASVPPHATRLAILTGVDGGAARALQQDADIDGDIWMVELARYDISSVPAVSNLTDNRTYVEHLPHGTIRAFVPAQAGYNVTDGSVMSLNATPYYFLFPINKICHGEASWQVPDNFLSGLTVRAIFVPFESGSPTDFLYIKANAGYAQINESMGTPSSPIGIHQTLGAYSQVPHTAGGYAYRASDPISLSSASRGDIVIMEGWRDATAVTGLDTLGGVYFAGFELSYTGVPATAEP